MFLKTRIFTGKEIINYVQGILNTNPVIHTNKQSWYDSEYSLDREFFIVPNHFHFLLIDDNGKWEDKISIFSFISPDNFLLQESADQYYHKKLETICVNSLSFNKSKQSDTFSTMMPRNWLPKDETFIQNKINFVLENLIDKKTR